MFIRLFLLAITCGFVKTGQSWYQCSNESSDGPYFCPDGNKCCSMRGNNDGGEQDYFGCISGSNPREGECCHDDLTTGCQEGYTCSSDGRCRNLHNSTEIPILLPRYKLCSIHHPYQRLVHYLPSNAAFLSSHPISSKGLQDVDQLWIIVHGSDHNPDDYLCCTLGVAASSKKIWIMTPWFLPDGSTIPGLQWAEHGPISHTWRYGANAVLSNVSSYDVLDDLVAYAPRVTTLTKIVVVGHSAGGQYVQRWALLTRAWTKQPPMRAIVANPKSFCWLDARRMFPEGFRLPSQDERKVCPTYNEWEWGFENSTGRHRESGALNTPYKDAAVAATGWPTIVERYKSRDVVYLAGELDVLWNGDCEDKMQGDYRMQRSDNFFKSLQQIYGTVTHRRVVVKGVHHDHCLMFQSPEGRDVFFGSVDTSVKVVQ